MQNMSKRVREEFYKEFYSRVLHSIPFFQGRFSKQFYDEIQTHLQEAVFVPGECITQHDKISTHLYYIVTGEVQQMIPSCQTHIAILKPGDSFDEESFVGQLPCKYEYVCKTVTQIVALSYEKLTEILESFKVDYEVFRMQVQEVNLGGQINHTKECISCKSKAHNVISCPLCHYEVNYDLFIKRYVSSQPQKRENIERNRKFKMTVSTEIMRKQLRNLRLKLPKNYCFRSQSDRQNIFLSETLFDMNQLSECDDAGFMIITPRIAYNPLVDDIEMILEDEEGEFEGCFFADEDILGKSLEQSFDDLTMMTHEFLGQVESGKREGRRNGLVLQKNEPATPLFPQENTKSSSEKEIKNQSQQELQDINNNITNYIPAGTNSRPSWFLNEEEDSLLANKGIDLQINSNNHSQTLTSQLKNVTIKQTNSNTNFNQSQYSSGFTKKSLMQTIQSKGLTSDSIDTSLGNEQQQQYVPVMIKSDKVPLPHLYGTEQRNQNNLLGTNSQISFKNRPKQSQLKRKSQSLILLNNEADPIQPQSQRDSMQSQSESSLVFTEKKVTKMIEKQCESHSELLINDTNYTQANKKQQKQSEQEKESLQSNKNSNDKSQGNKIAVTNSEQTKIILMQQQQLHQLQQQLKNCRMSYKNQGFKTSQLGNSNGTKLAAVAAIASMQSKHPNNIHKFPLKQQIQQINGQQAQMVENPYSSTSNLALSLSSSGNSNNNNGVAYFNQFSPHTTTNYGNHQQFFQQQQPGLFRQSPQFIVKSGSSDVNGSRSSNFLGSANNLGGVGGNQLGAYPAPKPQRISINLNEPSNTSVSSSNIKEFSNKTRLSSSSVASPGHMPLSQIQQSPHFFNSQMFQYQIGQQQLQQQQQQQAGTQLLPQQQQQQQLQQQNGGSVLSNTGTVSGKKQTFSGVSGVYNRISSMLGTGTIVKAQNKRQPEDQYKNIPIEMTTEEPLKEEIYQFMLDRFDQMKIFQCFFPHNNFDMVLSELKGKLKTAKSTPHRRGPKRIRKHNNRGSGNQAKDINSRYTTSQMASPALTALV